VTLKENILEVINARGPQSDKELAHWCKAKLPSVRRTRNELVKEGKLFLQPPSARGNVYGLEAVTVGEAINRLLKVSKKEEAPPYFELVPEKKPEKPKDPKLNWRNTGFTF